MLLRSSYQRVIGSLYASEPMNEQTKRGIAAFNRIKQRSWRYSVSPYTAHEAAIREHIARGFGDGLKRMAGLLDQRNKIA
jgi:hypothetical protein